MHCSIFKLQSDTNPTFSLKNMKEMPVTKATAIARIKQITQYTLKHDWVFFEKHLFSEHTWIAFPQ